MENFNLSIFLSGFVVFSLIFCYIILKVSEKKKLSRMKKAFRSNHSHWKTRDYVYLKREEGAPWEETKLIEPISGIKYPKPEEILETNEETAFIETTYTYDFTPKSRIFKHYKIQKILYLPK